jgi:hypothetical protein
MAMTQVNESNGNGGDNDPLAQAVDKLERAEERLARDRADEEIAEKEIHDAIEKIEEAKHDHVKVVVVHVNEAEKASFEEPVHATLQKVWDDAYGELKIERRPKDVFQTGGKHPKSLMTHLALTLQQALHQNVIEDCHFGIASETGGA